MYQKLKNISIAYKIYIPLIFIVVFGLSIVIINSQKSLTELELRAKQENTIKHHYVDKYVEQSKKILEDQIWTLIIVDALMLILLVILLDKTVRNPIHKLLSGIKKIDDEMDTGSSLEQIYDKFKLRHQDEDEIGKISLSVNSLLSTMSKTSQELQKSLLTDPLTKLQNRSKMLLDLDENSYLAIIDIHLFREKNDFYGHKIGDMILIELANRMQSYFSKNNMSTYHLGADEFAVISNEKFTTREQFFKAVNDFLSINRSHEFSPDSNININIRLTCGLSYSNENLVSYADIAHKYAKKSNLDIMVYSDAINTDQEYKTNLEWTSELSNAVKEDRIIAYYQPIINIKTKKIYKYETLMRLQKISGEIISPIEFLGIAKKTRIYKDLTKIIVNKAFDKFEHLDYSFSINLSVEDIMLNSVDEWIFDLAKEKNVVNKLVIEIVESEGIESFSEMQAFIKKAKEYGVRIAIDDFGTGYSNFEYLMKLNADYLKIDGSLINKIDSDEKLCHIVEIIVAFAKKNNIKVIGEYVSSKEIYDKSDSLDIDYAQGYYLGEPSQNL